MEIEEIDGRTEIRVDGVNVTVCHPRRKFGTRVEAEVSWPSIGSVSSARARAFAQALMKAVEIADAMSLPGGGGK